MSKSLVKLVLLGAGICAGLLSQANAQTVPSEVPKVVRIVVPFSPGGSNDLIARAIAPALARRLNTSVIVENRPGAAGVIGSEVVANAAPDGSTLLLTSSTFLTAAATQRRSPFDPVKSFTPVAMIAEGPLLLAVPASAPHRSPAELLQAARARPGQVSYGSSGVGSVAQLATELLASDAKVQLLHVPYKGAANALLDLMSGQIDLMISNYSSISAQIKAGRIRPLAVTSREPSPVFPDLPPLAAAVPGFAIDIWAGVLAPAGMPRPLLERLNREINQIAASPDVRNLLDPDGARPAALAPEAFATRIASDLAQWKRVATERSIVVE